MPGGLLPRGAGWASGRVLTTGCTVALGQQWVSLSIVVLPESLFCDSGVLSPVTGSVELKS